MKLSTGKRYLIGTGLVLLLWARTAWLFTGAEPPREKTDQELVNELLLKNKHLMIEYKRLAAECDARSGDGQPRAAAEQVIEEIYRLIADVVAINRRNPTWNGLYGPDPDPEVRQWFCEPAAAGR
ncbi:hypothetical protein [Fimbriiglobus ruber]|uniref:Uncharacterized protein n=1 Tax=Fimbriiglobus ruber TaxID=1908690 RepID=A0A225E578_9BACT|nr:hypothetical protein [Fimbriiglobus ruber]OWK45256.1 hypothetical protein FRUB_01587 [Fimbriiglobus ruber]